MPAGAAPQERPARSPGRRAVPLREHKKHSLPARASPRCGPPLASRPSGLWAPEPWGGPPPCVVASRGSPTRAPWRSLLAPPSLAVMSRPPLDQQGLRRPRRVRLRRRQACGIFELRRSQGVDDPSGRGRRRRRRRRGRRRRRRRRKRGGGGDGGSGGGGLWGALYLGLLESNPLATKCFTSGILNAARGDLFAQFMFENAAEKGTDWRRAGVFTFLGAVLVGPALHLWYGSLSKISLPPAPPGPLPRASPSRSTSSRSRPASSPSSSPPFHHRGQRRRGGSQAQAGLGYHRRQQLEKVWVPFQFLNFRFVPVNLQVGAANVRIALAGTPTCPSRPPRCQGTGARPGEGEGESDRRARARRASVRDAEREVCSIDRRGETRVYRLGIDSRDSYGVGRRRLVFPRSRGGTRATRNPRPQCTQSSDYPPPVSFP